MTVKKLVAKEITVTEDDLEPGRRMEPGEKYTVLVDPETGVYYRPRDGWVVTGDDLENLFVEVM